MMTLSKKYFQFVHHPKHRQVATSTSTHRWWTPGDDKHNVAKPIDAESDDGKPVDDKSVYDQPFATANDAMVPVEIIKTTVPAVSKGGTA